MFRRSEGFITGIRDHVPRYRLLNDVVFLSSAVELADQSVTKNERDAMLECNRRNCKGFVRNKKDGSTDFFHLLKFPYVEKNPVPEDETQLMELENFYPRRVSGFNNAPVPIPTPVSDPIPNFVFEVQPKITIVSMIIFIMVLLVAYLSVIRAQKDRDNLLVFTPDTYYVRSSP